MPSQPIQRPEVETLEARRLLAFTPAGEEVVVTPANSVNLDSDVAVAGNGNSLIVSVDFDDAQDKATLTARRYSPTGEAVGDTIVLSTTNTANLPSGPRVSAAMDADGDAVVAYLQNLNSADRNVHVFRISNAGVVSAEQLVGLGLVDWPAVSMDAGGGYFVGWVQHTTLMETAKVRAFDRTGTPRGDEITLESQSPVDDGDGGTNSWQFKNLDVASLPDGSGAVFAFEETEPRLLRSQVRFGRISATALTGSLGQVDHASDTDAAAPSIAVHPDASFVVGYELNSRPGQAVLGGFLQRYDAAQKPVGSVIDPGNAEPVGDAMGLDDTPDGGFVLLYRHRATSGPTTVDVRSYDAAGAPDPSGAITLDTLSAGQSTFAQTAIGVDDNGNAVATWLETGATSRVSLRRLSGADSGDVATVNGRVLNVWGTSAADTITIALSGANIVVTRGAASESFAASGVDVLIADGLSGDDTITNNMSLKSTLRGGAGNDTIFGGSGEDRIHGDVGYDALWGNDGMDRIYGEDGVDTCYGNGSNDRIEGGAQGDLIRGNGGRDKLFGNGGNDRMYGGASGDWITGQAGADRLFGEGGNDRLYGDDGGADELHGGAGDDAFVTVDSVRDLIFGDGGNDSANVDAQDALTSVATAVVID